MMPNQRYWFFAILSMFLVLAILVLIAVFELPTWLQRIISGLVGVCWVLFLQWLNRQGFFRKDE